MVDGYECLPRHAGATREQHIHDEVKFFEVVDNLLQVVMISVLAKNIVDVHMSLLSSKEMWEAFEKKLVCSNAGSGLYVME